MRITHEADYAIRILSYLSDSDGITGARQIAQQCGVSLKFTLKILRKLAMANIVSSQKGASGGFRLVVPPQDISFGQVIEAIDGPIAINHCLSCDFECTRVDNKMDCSIRKKFLNVNRSLREDLYKIHLDEI